MKVVIKYWMISVFIVGSSWASDSLCPVVDDNRTSHNAKVPLFIITENLGENDYNIIYREDSNEFLPFHMQPCQAEKAPTKTSSSGNVSPPDLEALTHLLTIEEFCPKPADRVDYRRKYVELADIFFECQLENKKDCDQKSIHAMIEAYLKYFGYENRIEKKDQKKASLIKKTGDIVSVTKDLSLLAKTTTKLSIETVAASVKKGTSTIDAALGCASLALSELKKKEEEGSLIDEIQQIDQAIKAAFTSGLKAGLFDELLEWIEYSHFLAQESPFPESAYALCDDLIVEELKNHPDIPNFSDALNSLINKKRVLEKKLKKIREKSSGMHWASCGLKFTKIASESNTISGLVISAAGPSLQGQAFMDLLGDIGAFATPVRLYLSIPSVVDGAKKVWSGASILWDDENRFSSELLPIVSAIKAHQKLGKDALNLGLSVVKTGTLAAGVFSFMPVASNIVGFLHTSTKLVKDYIIQPAITSGESSKISVLLAALKEAKTSDFLAPSAILKKYYNDPAIIQEVEKISNLQHNREEQLESFDRVSIISDIIQYKIIEELLSKHGAFLSFTMLAKLAEDILAEKQEVEAVLHSRLSPEQVEEITRLVKTGQADLTLDDIKDGFNIP